MGTRSDYKGFRYRPRQTKWDSNLELKQEFENIGNEFGRAIKQLDGDIGSITDTVSALSSKLTDTDVLVKINDNDPIAAKLALKLIAGTNILFNIVSTINGLAIVVEAKSPSMVIVKDFNTFKHVGEAERLVFEFDHPIPNEYYLFDIYRPLEKYDSGSTATYSGGEERGRFQVRWKSVSTKPNHFKVNFHQPEFGTIVLIGASTVQRT
jgi:hypothetical protein